MLLPRWCHGLSSLLLLLLLLVLLLLLLLRVRHEMGLRLGRMNWPWLWGVGRRQWPALVREGRWALTKLGVR